MTEVEFITPLPIPDEAFVYRQVHITHLQSLPNNKKDRIPKESHFKPDPDGLSVHWADHIDVQGVYDMIGISYKMGTTEYKDYRMFKIFSLPVGFLRQSEGIQSVVHSPVYNGNPAPIGSPNNYAHSSILYPNDEEIRLKLSDYCSSNFASCYCNVDFKLLDTEIEPLRERLNTTKYHLLPTANEKAD